MIGLMTRNRGAVFITTWSHPGPKVPVTAGTRLFREILRPETVVRASGGVHDLDAVLAYHDAGARRLGASQTAAILDDLRARIDAGLVTG
jgi:deoxyribose-phosphate aldolase